MKKRIKSERIFKEMSQLIPGGVNSPVRSCSEMGQLPMIVDHAERDIIVDADGNSYIDYCGSWGALIHGHSNPKILGAVQNRMAKGTTFGISTEIEGKIANEIVKLIESVEKIRFVSSGTEATMSAARLARGYTNRDIIIKFSGNYHGHADFFLVQAGSGVFNLSQTSSSAGIPAHFIQHTISLPYNDIETCRKVFSNPDYKNRIAGVILEPIAANMGVIPAERQFIKFLREETAKMGSVLIFDEVITGFRIGLKGALDYYGIDADLVCFGKIIGGGFPAAAFGGKKAIMDCLAPLGPVYQAGTLSGNPIAMEAGYQALRMVQEPKFYVELQRKADLLIKPLIELIKKRDLEMCIQHVGSMFTIFFGKKRVRDRDDVKGLDNGKFAEFFRYMFEHGVYIPPSQYEAWFVSSVHQDENLNRTRDLVEQFLLKI